MGDNVPLRVDDRERDATRAAREHELLRSDALLDLLLHGAQSLGAGLARVLLEGSAYAMHEERGRQRERRREHECGDQRDARAHRRGNQRAPAADRVTHGSRRR